MLAVNGKKVLVELFAADLWPEKNTGEGLYRVRIDGRWHSPAGKFTFLPLFAVGALAATLLSGGAPVEAQAMPRGFEKPVRVRAACGECVAGLPVLSELAWTITPPHLGPDGRWYVWCALSTGKSLLPVEDVEILRR